MANYSQLKTAVQNVVKTNGNQEITGANLQSVLLNIINTIGANYTFAGIATPDTDPGTPDQNVFYLAPAGTYANFAGGVVPYGHIGVFLFDGSWNQMAVQCVADPGVISPNIQWHNAQFVNTDGTLLSGAGWENWNVTSDIHLVAGQTIECNVASTGRRAFAAISIHANGSYTPVVVKSNIGSTLYCHVEYQALTACDVVICSAQISSSLPLSKPLVSVSSKMLGDLGQYSPMSKKLTYIGADSSRIDQAFMGVKGHTYVLLFDNPGDWTVANIGSGNVCVLLGTSDDHFQSAVPVTAAKYTCITDGALLIYFRADTGCVVNATLYDATLLENEIGGLVINDYTETKGGQNNTYVNLTELNDMLRAGHDYIFIPNRTSWEVAQNTLSYNVFAFNISYYIGGVRTNLYGTRILTGQSVMEEPLPAEITFHMPDVQWDRTEIGFRAIAGEEVGGELIDITYGSAGGAGGTGILDLFPSSHYLPKVATLKKKTPYGYSPVNTPLVLQWFSDIHGNTTNLERIVTWKENYAQYIDAVLNCGDTLTDNWATCAADMDAYFANGGEDILNVVGNHDVTSSGQTYKGWSANGLTIQQIYNAFIKPMNITSLGIVQPTGAEANGYGFYYKDFVGLGKANAGIRLIVLDSSLKVSNITASGSGASASETEAYNTAQRTWLASALEGARTLGYAVVCATHYATHMDEFVTDSGFAAYDKALNPAEDNKFQDYFLQEVDTFIDNGGEFVAWLCGHVHTDHIGVSHNYPNQLVIAVTTATPRLYSAESNEPARINGTITQDAFDHIEIDPYYKQVRLLRIGYDFDSYGRKIDMLVVNYANKTVLR